MVCSEAIIMNKINHRGRKHQQFISPWEESFINLAKTFKHHNKPEPKQEHQAPPQPSPQTNRQLSIPRRLYLSIDHPHKLHDCKCLQRLLVKPHNLLSKKDVLNTSKINLLRNNNNTQMPYMIRNESKKFQGPRLTFYSKMNPKCNQMSIYKLKKIQRNTQKSLFSHQSFNKTICDESYKYLNIIEEQQKYDKNTQLERINNEEDSNHKFTAYLRAVFANKQSEVKTERKNKEDDHNTTMKRLKVLYNQKRYSSIVN